MGESYLRQFEAFVLGSGWLGSKECGELLKAYEREVAAGETSPLPDFCVAGGYLTPRQAQELTKRVKTPMACPGCDGRFNVGGRTPAAGWTCPRCRRALEPILELALEIGDSPAVLNPGHGDREKQKEQDPPPRKKGVVLALSMAGGATLLFGVVLVLLFSGADSASLPPPPAAASKSSEPEKTPSRITLLRKEWEKVAEGVETARRDPTRIADVVPLLDRMVERSRGTEFESKARSARNELLALEADRKVAFEVRTLMDDGEFGGAMNLVRSYSADPNASEGLAKSLKAIGEEIKIRAAAQYESLLRQARELSEAGDPWRAKTLILQATRFGVPEIADRARRESEDFLAQALSRTPEKLKLAAEDPASPELRRLESKLTDLEKEGKLGEAIGACESFIERFPAAAGTAKVRERIGQFRNRLARLAAPAPEPPSIATKIAGIPDASIVSPRRPRDGDYTPGGMSDPEKQKRHSELSSGAKKERRGALKAAAAKRAERLAGLERDLGIYDIATIQDRGDVARRVDIVIVSSGFPKSDARKVNQMAESLKTSLLKVDPFQNYPDYINVHRINVDDSGTHAKAHIPFKVESQILTCDFGKAIDYARMAPGFDLVVVLCNVTNVRATGGPPIITIDASLDMGRTFLHEMGHAFASLNDEYVDPGLAPVRPFREEEDNEWQTNVTSQPNPRLAKWHYWREPVWPAPHEPNRLPPGHRVGCFEGAAYQPKGVYRPEESCLMQTGDRYCVVCFEHVEKRFYRLIAPIDDARPHQPRVGLWSDETVVLEADAIRTSASGRETIGKFEGFWYVDGEPRDGNAKNLTTALTLQGAHLGAGVHEAALRVDFSNKRVRRDQGWLSSSIGWKIDVLPYKKPKWEGPAALVPGRVGQPVSFDVKVANPDPQRFRIEARDLPEGASYVGGRFTWLPRKEDQGAWRPRFVLTDGLRTVEKSVEIAVLDLKEKNFEPVVSPMESRLLMEGERLELPLEVVDVDGDNLVFSSPNLPEGAELDAYEGVLRWTPSLRQAGRYPGIVIEVFDGRRKVRGSVELIVDDQPHFDALKEDLLNALRAAHPSLRAQALNRLEPHGRSFQSLEASRLLRDRNKEVRKAALSTLERLAESGDQAFLAMMIGDLLPHLWHFTDHKEILAWLGTLTSKIPANDPKAKTLRSTLKAIEKYNKDRGL